MRTNQQLNINNKFVTFRYNPNRLCFEANYGYKDNYNQRQSRVIRGRSVEELKTNLINFDKKIKDSSILSDSITFANFFDFYINAIASAINCENTINNKKATYKLLPENLKRLPLKDITPTFLQIIYSDLYKKYKHNTVKYIHQLINTVLSQAVLHKIISENPNKLCNIKGYQAVDKVYLSPNEIKGFLDFLKNHKRFKQLYKPVLFLAYTGCRKGECLGLKRCNIDIDNCIVYLCTQITNTGYKEQLKTKNSNRKIKVPKFIIDEITNYDCESDFVFTTPYRHVRYNPSNFATLINKASKEYGIVFSSKVFRNSLVKTSIKNGIPLKVVQNILGHARLSTTADIYGNLNQEDTFYTSEIIEKAYS